MMPWLKTLYVLAMTQLHFLPHLPFPANPLALFGLLLLAGLIGGELVKRVLHLPRITGYVLIGMLLGASGFGLLDKRLIAEAWIFVDIASGAHSVRAWAPARRHLA